MVKIPPEGYALLKVIASGESGGDYRLQYGDRQGKGSIVNFADHPREGRRIQSGPHKGELTHVAGAYQFQATTWDHYAKKLGLKDFSPESQDQAAWADAQAVYKAKTGGDLTQALKSGDYKSVSSALKSEWTSLPGGIEQGTSKKTFAKVYEAALSDNTAKAAASPSTALDAINLAVSGAGPNSVDPSAMTDLASLVATPTQSKTDVSMRVVGDIPHVHIDQAIANITAPTYGTAAAAKAGIKVLDINPDGTDKTTGIDVLKKSAVEAGVLSADGSASAGTTATGGRETIGPIAKTVTGSSSGKGTKVDGSPGSALMDIFGGLTEALTGGSVEVKPARDALAHGVSRESGAGRDVPRPELDSAAAKAEAKAKTAQSRFDAAPPGQKIQKINAGLGNLFGLVSVAGTGAGTGYADTGNGNPSGVSKTAATVNVRPDGSETVVSKAGSSSGTPASAPKSTQPKTGGVPPDERPGAIQLPRVDVTPRLSTADQRLELEAKAAQQESQVKRAMAAAAPGMIANKVTTVPIGPDGQPILNALPAPAPLVPQNIGINTGITSIAGIGAGAAASAGEAGAIPAGGVVAAPTPARITPAGKPRSNSNNTSPTSYLPASVTIGTGKRVPVRTQTKHGGTVQDDGSIKFSWGSTPGPGQPAKWWQANNPENTP